MAYFQKGQNENDPKFDEVAFGTKVNVVSPVFETALGYQFLKVTESRPAGIPTVAEASPMIMIISIEIKRRAAGEARYMKKLLTDDKTITYPPGACQICRNQPKPGAQCTLPQWAKLPDTAPVTASASCCRQIISSDETETENKNKLSPHEA